MTQPFMDDCSESAQDLCCQCELHRHEKQFSGGYVAIKVAFIPIKYAVLGKVLKIQNNAGRWIDGWVVMSVGEPMVPPNIHKEIKSHRKRTGDSLPKERA